MARQADSLSRKRRSAELFVQTFLYGYMLWMTALPRFPIACDGLRVLLQQIHAAVFRGIPESHRPAITNRYAAAKVHHQ